MQVSYILFNFVFELINDFQKQKGEGLKLRYQKIDVSSTYTPTEYAARELAAIWLDEYYDKLIENMGESDYSVNNVAEFMRTTIFRMLTFVACDLPRSLHRLEDCKLRVYTKNHYLLLIPHLNFGVFSVSVLAKSIKFYANGYLILTIPLTEYGKIVETYNNFINIANITGVEDEPEK